MELSQQLLAVGLVLALLLLAAAAAQRRGWVRLNWRSDSEGSRRPLEILDRIQLTPQHQLHLLRTEGRTLLIATHPRGVEVVSGRPDSAGAQAGQT